MSESHQLRACQVMQDVAGRSHSRGALVEVQQVAAAVAAVASPVRVASASVLEAGDMDGQR